MNKINSFLQRQKNNITALAASATVAVGSVASFARADLTADIGSIASTIGTTYQTSGVTLLNAVLPYVVTISIVFLAAKLALRWMRRSAN